MPNLDGSGPAKAGFNRRQRCRRNARTANPEFIFIIYGQNSGQCYGRGQGRRKGRRFNNINNNNHD